MMMMMPRQGEGGRRSGSGGHHWGRQQPATSCSSHRQPTHPPGRRHQPTHLPPALLLRYPPQCVTQPRVHLWWPAGRASLVHVMSLDLHLQQDLWSHPATGTHSTAQLAPGLRGGQAGAQSNRSQPGTMRPCHMRAWEAAASAQGSSNPVRAHLDSLQRCHSRFGNGARAACTHQLHPEQPQLVPNRCRPWLLRGDARASQRQNHAATSSNVTNGRRLGRAATHSRACSLHEGRDGHLWVVGLGLGDRAAH